MSGAEMKQVGGGEQSHGRLPFISSARQTFVYPCLAVSVGSDHCLIETIVLLTSLSKK